MSKRTTQPMQLSCFSCSRNVLCWFVTEYKTTLMLSVYAYQRIGSGAVKREQERWVWFGNSLTSAPAGVDCTSLPWLFSRSGHSSSLKQPFETGLSCRFHSLDQAGLTHRDLLASDFYQALTVPPHSAKSLIIKPFGVRTSTGS